MKRIFVISLILSLMFSCVPKQADNTDQVNENSSEILTLEQQIAKLEAELELQKDEIKNQKEKQEVPYVSNDPDYNQMQANLDELRSDIVRLIQQLDQKYNTRLQNLEGLYTNFKAKLNNIENNYVDLSAFEALKIDIQNNLNRKERTLYDLKRNTIDPQEIKKIKSEIVEIKDIKKNITKEYQSYFATAITAWNKKMIGHINSENAKQSKQLKKLIKNEVERIKMAIEAADNKIAAMDIEIDQLMQSSSNYAPPIVKDYTREIAELKNSIAQNQEHLSNIKLESNKANLPELYNDIVEKQFAPCSTGGLNNNKYCYTLGSMITRLGGVFLDPTNFPRTQKDFVRYLTLSGVTIKAVTDYTSIFLMPDKTQKKQKNGELKSNMDKFKECHPNGDQPFLIAPHKYWPRAIVLSLILQNIEKDLLKQRSLKFLPKENKAEPISSVAAWYRTKCYQKKISHSHDGDHVYGSAFDLSFGDKDNDDTFEFYRNYVRDNIWKYDTFEIVHPLKSSGLVFSTRTGLGHGHHGNGRFHLGIGSEVKNTNGKTHQDWGYENTINGKTKKYSDLISHEIH